VNPNCARASVSASISDRRDMPAASSISSFQELPK
jgi:hypothetical protein